MVVRYISYVIGGVLVQSGAGVMRISPDVNHEPRADGSGGRTRPTSLAPFTLSCLMWRASGCCFTDL